MPDIADTKTSMPEKLGKKIKDVIDSDFEIAEPKLRFGKFVKVLIPYFIVLFGSLLTVVIGSIFLTWWNLFGVLFPVSAFAICHFYWKRAKVDLENEIKNYDSSESEITRIIDKYSGIIDGIGTALPLVGAAFLLGVVSANISDADKKELWFIKIAIPVEVLSILMLAAAKLFEPAFDQLAVIFQNIIDHAKRQEIQFYHEETLEEIRSQSNGSVYNTLPTTNEIDIVKLEAIGKLMDKIDSSVSGLKDQNVSKSLESLVDLVGVSKNQKT